MKLLPLFQDLPDHRRRQARRYDLPHVLLFTVMAIMSGANSYRTIATFISCHFLFFQTHCNLSWKRPPAYTALRNILRGLDPVALEAAFRKHAASLADLKAEHVIAIDGKSLRGSFDHGEEQRPTMLVSAFASHAQLILGHVVLDGTDKNSEIPAARQLMDELGLQGKLFSLDALHCQKNHLDSYSA